MKKEKNNQNNTKPRQIVVLGGGFGGVRTCLSLAKKMPKDRIILVSQSQYHEYYPALYEVATTTKTDGSAYFLKQTAAFSLTDIVKQHKNLIFKQAWVGEIDLDHQIVHTDGGELYYDVLVVALGSKTDYFEIDGLEENSYGLKSFRESIILRNHIELSVDTFLKTGNQQYLNFIVGGGGFTGVEFSGELRNYLKKILPKNAQKLSKVYLIEGTAKLLGNISPKVSSLAYERLQKIGTEIFLNTKISRADENGVELDSGEFILGKTIVWTGGIESLDCNFNKNIGKDQKNRIIVNNYLNLDQYKEVFAIGDNCIISKEQNISTIPQTAVVALHQAEYVSKSIVRKFSNQKISEYVPKKYWPTIIPISGKYAIFVYKNYVFSGIFPFLLKKFVDLHYFLKTIQFVKALKFWFKGSVLYLKNDQ